MRSGNLGFSNQRHDCAARLRSADVTLSIRVSTFTGTDTGVLGQHQHGIRVYILRVLCPMELKAKPLSLEWFSSNNFSSTQIHNFKPHIRRDIVKV